MSGDAESVDVDGLSVRQLVILVYHSRLSSMVPFSVRSSELSIQGLAL